LNEHFENRDTLQHDREFIMFRFYLPLFMVLLKAFDICWGGGAFWVPCMRRLC